MTFVADMCALKYGAIRSKEKRDLEHSRISDIAEMPKITYNKLWRIVSTHASKKGASGTTSGEKQQVFKGSQAAGADDGAQRP